MDRRLSTMRGRPRGERVRRGLAWVAVVLAVVLLHAVATRELADRMAQFDLANAMPERIAVAYVRTIEPEAPAVASRATAPVRKRAPPKSARRPSVAASASEETKVAAAEPAASAPAVKSAASAPEVVTAASMPVEESVLVAREDAGDRTVANAAPTTEQSAASAAAAADGATSAPAGGATAATFQWPGATRVSYVLSGNYRGEVSGNAQVEWIRVGARYQVNLDLIVGPEFAPIISRKMTSEGRLTPEGLVPERYDEDTQVAFRDRRRMTVVFESDAVVLGNGERREHLAGVQDTASQFIQLTYLFSTQPDRLRVGSAVGFPLALPRAMDNYVYEVVDDRRLDAPFGNVAAFHLKPRPRPNRRPGQLTVELWISPELRYLPVRIRIEQDEATFIDLMIADKPEIGAAETVSSGEPPRRTP